IATGDARVAGFHAAPDRLGGAFAAWSDRRSGGLDVYASRILADGTLASGFPPAGAPLCVAPGDPGTPLVVTLSPGVSIAVWTDGRSLVDQDVYAKRIEPDAPVPARAAGVVRELTARRVALEWRVSRAVGEVTVEKSLGGDEWGHVSRVSPGSLEVVRFVD